MKIRNLITSAAITLVSLVVRPDRKLPRHRAPGKPVTFLPPAEAPAEVKVPAPLAVEDVKQVPAVGTIEQAARDYDQARLSLNAATRTKNKAAKVLAQTTDGIYGAVTVERFQSSRQVADLDAIRALLEANGLGDVPMKTCAPSITLTFDTAHQLAA